MIWHRPISPRRLLSAVLSNEELQNVRYNYAYALIQIKRFNESAAQLEKSLTLKPSDEVKYLKLLGFAYSKANKADKALRIYETLIKKASDYAPAYFNAADIYHRFRNDAQKSIEDAVIIVQFAAE